MKQLHDDDLAKYYQSSQSWADSNADADSRWKRAGWLVAALLGAIAVVEAIAIVIMLPLQRTEPYTLLVDRHTGYVEALTPLSRQTITPDAALTRSFLVQYVIAREGFDIDAFRTDYRKVALWSAGDARSQYMGAMQASNPASPLAALPRSAVVNVEIRSVASLSNNTSMVRYATIRTDPGGQPQPAQLWQAVIRYQFSGAAMSAADRLTNPLGFQVTRYNREAEIVQQQAPIAAPQASPPL